MLRKTVTRKSAITLSLVMATTIALVGGAAAYSPAGKAPRQDGDVPQHRQAYLPGVWQSVPAKGWFAPRQPGQMNIVGVIHTGTSFDRVPMDVPAPRLDATAARTQPPMGMTPVDAMSASAALVAMRAEAQDVSLAGRKQARETARIGYASLDSSPQPSDQLTAMYGGTPSLSEDLPAPWDFASLEASPEAIEQLAAMYGGTSSPSEQLNARMGYASLASASSPSRPLVAMYGGNTSPAERLTGWRDDTPLPAFTITPVVYRDRAGTAVNLEACATDDRGLPVYTKRWAYYLPVRVVEMPEHTAQPQWSWAFTMDRERAGRNFARDGIHVAANSRNSSR